MSPSLPCAPASAAWALASVAADCWAYATPADISMVLAIANVETPFRSILSPLYALCSEGPLPIIVSIRSILNFVNAAGEIFQNTKIYRLFFVEHHRPCCMGLPDKGSRKVARRSGSVSGAGVAQSIPSLDGPLVPSAAEVHPGGTRCKEARPIRAWAGNSSRLDTPCRARSIPTALSDRGSAPCDPRRRRYRQTPCGCREAPSSARSGNDRA